jgi:putative nucleotidyltransferase with HDIG domain
MAQDSLAAFISALESKDEFTRDHSARVSELAARIARQVKPTDIGFHTEVRFGGLLHDIGKIGIRESVINKPGALTPREFAEVQKHPVIGETILRPVVANPNVLAIVRNHHERFDGGGYPDALSGQAIPLGARIVAVADSYDAMTSARPYRVGMSPERAIEILREGAGSQWDRTVIHGFLSLVNNGLLPERARHASRREKALPTASDIVLPADDFLRNAA